MITKATLSHPHYIQLLANILIIDPHDIELSSSSEASSSELSNNSEFTQEDLCRHLSVLYCTGALVLSGIFIALNI